MWVYALALPLAGIVGDRVSRKTLILAGLIFWSLITVATALSTKFWHLFLFRALEGFGEAFYFPRFHVADQRLSRARGHGRGRWRFINPACTPARLPGHPGGL